jgi:hypothetical protein
MKEVLNLDVLDHHYDFSLTEWIRQLGYLPYVTRVFLSHIVKITLNTYTETVTPIEYNQPELTMLYSDLFYFLFSILITVTNSSNQSEQSPTITDWFSAIGTVGGMIAAIGIGAYSLYRTRSNETKQGLSKVFELLNDNAHRNARRRIYNLYQENEDYRKKKILKVMGVKEEDLNRMDAIHKESKEIVKADFDQIGSLVEDKAVQKDEFLRIYWYEVLKCWKALYDDEIKEIRDTLGDNNYMANFEKLVSYAENFKNINVNKIEITKDVIINPKVINVKPYVATPKYKINVTFDHVMDESTINANTVSLEDRLGNDIPGGVSWSSPAKTAIFETDKSKWGL